MASLLNMLNNFLGSAGKPSIFNLNSTNTSQSVEFKDIVSKLLNGGGGEQRDLTALLLNPAGGADLPLSDSAGGNGLPPLLATAATNIDFDAEMTQRTAPGGELPTGLAADQQADTEQLSSGELLALQPPVTAPSATNAVDQAAILTNPSVEPLNTELETTVSAALQTPQLSGADLQHNGSQNQTVDSTPVRGQAPSTIDPIAQAAIVDSSATPSVKLDSVQQVSEQAVDSSINTGSSPTNTAVLEPAPVATVTSPNALEAPLQAVQPAIAPPLDARPQLAAANDAIIPGTANTTTPAAQTQTQPVAPAADLDAALPQMLTTRDPQQMVVEQALGDNSASDNDAPAEITRQTALPAGPQLRAAPASAAPLQSADTNFANVAAQLNQGQSMNSLNQRLQFMLLNGQNSAEIQLDPPELGSLQVRVTTRHEQTSVIFVAPNNAVRDALEQQLPRLRDTLESAGLQLQDANVFAQTEDKPGTQPQSYADVESADELAADELTDSNSRASSVRVSTQLVDAYI